jgi:hypothetical protein
MKKVKKVFMVKRKLTLGLFVTLAGVIAAMNIHLNSQKSASIVSLHNIRGIGGRTRR